MEKSKYSQNKYLKLHLYHGDMAALALKLNLSRKTIYEVLAGRRRMKDYVKKAILDLIKSRNELENDLNNVL